MNISPREMILAFVTLLAVLIGVTVVLGRAKIDEWKKLRGARENVEEQILLNQRLIDQREEWDARLKESKDRLKAYPAGVNIIPKLLEDIEQIATANDLTLPNVSHERENVRGDVSEVGIRYSWEGELPAVVKFLYALQADPESMYKIRTINVTPTGKEGRLKGSFVVDCAYTRSDADPAAAESTLQVEPVPAP